MGLRLNGFDGWIAQWMGNWLDGHIQKVVVNSSRFGWRLVMSDISQRSLLGPLGIKVPN